MFTCDVTGAVVVVSGVMGVTEGEVRGGDVIVGFGALAALVRKGLDVVRAIVEFESLATIEARVGETLGEWEAVTGVVIFALSFSFTGGDIDAPAAETVGPKVEEDGLIVGEVIRGAWTA